MNAVRAGAALVLTAAALVLTPSSATAKTAIDLSLKADYARCAPLIRGAGLGSILGAIEANDKDNTLVPGPNFSFPKDPIAMKVGGSSAGVLNWQPNDQRVLEAGVVNNDCATLVHEATHIKDYNEGTFDTTNCGYTKDGVQHDTGTKVAEVHATAVENVYRHARGLPLRTQHSPGEPLPPDGLPCRKPEPPPRRPSSGCSASAIGANCAGSTGDPHMRTFDGRRYDFMAAGEFTLVRSTVGGLRIQSRQAAFPGSRVVTVNTAVAADVAGDRIGIYLADNGIAVRVNGSDTKLAASGTDLPKGGTAGVDPDGTIWVVWPDGSLLEARPIGPWGLGLAIGLPDGYRGKVEGLLGNFDGEPSSDLMHRGGAGITDSFDGLYPGYADSWRIPATESLFDYASGQGPDTFTDRSLPARPVTVAELPNRATAEFVCQRAGVTDPDVLPGCIADVALTGQPAFASDAAVAQRTDGDDRDATLVVTSPGGSAGTTVSGQAGQRLFVDVVSSNLPDECGALELRGPDSRLLNAGCLSHGRGLIDATVLPLTGEYSVVLDPSGPAAGRAEVRMSVSTDEVWIISADGAAGTATVASAGAVSRASFNAAAGQKVFVDATSLGLPDQCGVLQLRGPDGRLLNIGCLNHGVGLIDGTVLPSAGRYTIAIDPRDRDVGKVELRLVNAPDQEAAIMLDGPKVTVEVPRPGAVAQLRFVAAAGQKVFVDATSLGLPDQCGVLQLRGPDGRLLNIGCLNHGVGLIDGTVLPSAGRYTIAIDPRDRDVGKVAVALRR